ncbi:uncharacterized protein TNCV_1646691 [Trichonephila clavipes]|nr:uncharacterized protein TNCV_1646691 [Trichonephila clavipes]
MHCQAETADHMKVDDFLKNKDLINVSYMLVLSKAKAGLDILIDIFNIETNILKILSEFCGNHGNHSGSITYEKKNMLVTIEQFETMEIHADLIMGRQSFSEVNQISINQLGFDSILSKGETKSLQFLAENNMNLMSNLFVEWAQNETAIVPDFHKRILFSDEAHFWLNGYVNKQNCRICSEANPQVYVETPLHPEKLTVWCALWAGGIIGPYFFKNDEGHNNNHDVQELWFQQDGACHTARATIDLLKDTFGDRLISRFGPVNWRPRSCDLTPLDYFLWGYVKSLVYADKPQTLDHLEDNIRRDIADIRPQMLEKVIENWTSRWDYIRACRGSHMPEIIFKI